MAASILKGLSFPKLVASVEIDAGAKQGPAKNCKVTDVAATDDGGVNFEQLDEALPFFPERGRRASSSGRRSSTR